MILRFVSSPVIARCCEKLTVARVFTRLKPGAGIRQSQSDCILQDSEACDQKRVQKRIIFTMLRFSDADLRVSTLNFCPFLFSIIFLNNFIQYLGLRLSECLYKSMYFVYLYLQHASTASFVYFMTFFSFF